MSAREVHPETVVLSYRLEGAVDDAALAGAIEEVVARHEPVRIVPLEVADLSGAAEPDAELARVEREQLARALDPRRGPTLRARLLTLGPRLRAVVIAFHAPTFGAAWEATLADELGALYAARSAGDGRAPDPAATVLAAGVSARILPLTLPADRAPDQGASAQRSVRTAALGSGTATRLRTLDPRERLDAVADAFAAVLARCAGASAGGSAGGEGDEQTGGPRAQVVLAPGPPPAPRLSGVAVRSRRAVSAGSRFEIALELAEDATALRWDHRADLFETSTVEELHRQLERALDPAGAVADADGELLEAWNATAVPFPDGRCLHELFEQLARERGAAPALAADDERLTYAELDAAANRLAHHLRDLGVERDSPVVIYMARSPELVVALLAILKAGGAYVPIDAAYPVERAGFIAGDVGAGAAVVDAARADALPPHVRTVCPTRDRAAIARLPSTAPEPATDSTGAACVLYTSGTTGRPKGALLEHRSLVNFVEWMRREYDVGAADRILCASSPSFDAFGIEVYGALLSGAELVLVPGPDAHDPGRFLGTVVEREVSIFFAVPSLLSVLLEHPLAEACGCVRQVILGGEVLRLELARRLAELGLEATNTYGPTEVTIAATFHRLDERDVDGSVARVPIGRPLPNASVHVLDEQRRPLPPLAVGELYVGGAGVARGYVNRAELTAERFLPDAFADGTGCMYRTGDLARRLPDGTLEFVGRIDHQVKIRGVRIEPGEIAATLARHPAVGRAEVLVPRGEGAARLVAFVCPSAPGAALPAHDELIAFLEERLPAQMVPQAIVALDTMPLIAAGKVDRKRLEALAPAPAPRRAAPTAPSTPSERLLAEIWAEVLQLDAIGVHDDFFADLGGHSLKAAQVVARLSQRTGREFRLRLLFEAPTVAAAAARIDAEIALAGVGERAGRSDG